MSEVVDNLHLFFQLRCFSCSRYFIFIAFIKTIYIMTKSNITRIVKILLLQEKMTQKDGAGDVESKKDN